MDRRISLKHADADTLRLVQGILQEMETALKCRSWSVPVAVETDVFPEILLGRTRWLMEVTLYALDADATGGLQKVDGEAFEACLNAFSLNAGDTGLIEPAEAQYPRDKLQWSRIAAACPSKIDVLQAILRESRVRNQMTLPEVPEEKEDPLDVDYSALLARLRVTFEDAHVPDELLYLGFCNGGGGMSVEGLIAASGETKTLVPKYAWPNDYLEYPPQARSAGASHESKSAIWVEIDCAEEDAIKGRCIVALRDKEDIEWFVFVEADLSMKGSSGFWLTKNESVVRCARSFQGLCEDVLSPDQIRALWTARDMTEETPGVRECRL
jgi:hypothetical protein